MIVTSRIPAPDPDLAFAVALFPTAMPAGPAFGRQERIAWTSFAAMFRCRREGAKDGPCFVPARFAPQPDGRVRRLKQHVVSRTAIALDIEHSKQTGEVPPPFAAAIQRLRSTGWVGLAYTSHSHTDDAPRYRLVLPLADELDPELPAPEVIADKLELKGVLDGGKLAPSSLFYLPSCAPGQRIDHHSVIIDGAPIDPEWIRTTAGTLLAARLAEADRIAAEAHAAAEARRQAKLAAGFDPDASLIERLRPHFSLESVLTAHGYERRGTKFRHPNSTSGSFGADIKVLGGIERVFSHNATDPLHASNLLAWCGSVTALDVIDVIVILDFGGDRRKALRELADRLHLTKTTGRKAVAAVIFRMLRRQAAQHEIEAAAFAEGSRQGLTRAEVCAVATWVARTAADRAAA